MKTIKEIKEWLLRNAVDEDGDLNLSGLDLSDFEGNVKLSSMKVKGNLSQGHQQVEGDLIQRYQNVKGDLIQNSQEVEGDLYQNSQEVKGDLYQDKIINGKTKAQAIKELEKIYENN